MTLRPSLLAVALLLAACSRPEPAGPEARSEAGKQTGRSGDRVVYVYNWSDYVAEDTLANFERDTGIKVVYDVYDSNEMLEAKLLAGASGYDVVFPSARPFAQRHIEAGVYRPLDKDRLSNLDNLDPRLMAGLRDVDPGNAHTLPYMWGTTGLGINLAKVREALGEDVPLDSWSLLFDPVNAEKLAGCGISVLDDEQEAFAAALIWKGMDPNAVTGREVELVTQAYQAIKPHIRYFNSSRYIDDLANGDLCLAMGYSGDVAMAAARSDEAETGFEIVYVIPKEGALRWVDLIAMPKDAPHPDEAHVFIDYLLRPEVAAAISSYVAYASPNLAARPLLDPEVAEDPSVYPPEEVMAKLVDPQTLPAEVTRERVRAWTAIKTGQ
ncbi:polyamine ABC transporter substrate-binding protein [Arenimonas fontis]|uniref:Putrescine-binding periplasmic protein n=1 Tax=Arenimonas fontis TaxID=2608255 RepID=A0A5B2ZAB8_9GAMM|nr:polyamine ABC transporter substrate-binding protein [Arenimonas fontis]KAA2285608.1 polyamine ABC transporter substrate-binding protein [Arenimonas fontis]